MNLANRITLSRIFMTILIIVIMLFPYADFGMGIKVLKINTQVGLPVTFLISGLIFIVGSITDFIDGNIARKKGMVTDLGKMLDAIADKLLVNSSLIILTYYNLVPVIVTVIIVSRDTVVNAIKMQAASKGKVVAAINSGKLKTATLMVGIALAYFKNIPFSIFGYSTVSDAFLYFASILSIISMYEYFQANKHLISE